MEKICALCHCEQLAKKVKKAEDQEFYYICGKCLRIFNETIVELSLIVESDFWKYDEKISSLIQRLCKL